MTHPALCECGECPTEQLLAAALESVERAYSIAEQIAHIRLQTVHTLQRALAREASCA